MCSSGGPLCQDNPHGDIHKMGASNPLQISVLQYCALPIFGHCVQSRIWQEPRKHESYQCPPYGPSVGKTPMYDLEPKRV